MTTGADWLDSARRLFDTLRPPAGAAAGQDGAAHGADCRWCPVCQTAAVLRGERPEVTAALADVLATTASALRELAGETRAADPAAGDEPGSDDEDPGSLPVQRIDIA